MNGKDKTHFKYKMKKIKIISWNVNGLRAVYKKGALQNLIQQENPDILCIQEIKCTEDQLSEDQKNLKYSEEELQNNNIKYVSVFESAKNRKGYSGVGVYVKKEINFKVLHATLNKKDFYDEEGRTIVLEFDKFYLINCYFPNGGKSQEHYEYKLQYYKHFLELSKKLEKKKHVKNSIGSESGTYFTKPVIWCGDVNATNTDNDLARPKENKDKLGCTAPEREALRQFMQNFIDTYRHKNGEKIQYTWWDMKTRSRDKNVGWRIDYLYTSKSLKDNIIDSKILDQIFGSDHCPISLEIKD